MSIRVTDFMASMGINTFIVDEKGIRKVESNLSEEEAVKKLYEDD